MAEKIGLKGDRLIERRGSMGTIDELLKRKRDLNEEKEVKEKGEKEEGEEWAFQSKRKEREERRGNIIIKGIKEGKGELNEEVAKLLKEIGVEAPVEEVKRIGMRRKDRARMALVKIGNWDIKKEIMEKRIRLKGREERIEDDWTWKERKMMWNLGLIAKKQEREGKRTWIKYGRIRIERKWWRWDERKEMLKEEGLEGGMGREIRGNGEVREAEFEAEKLIKRGKRVRGRGKGEGEGWKVAFWNVAGIGNKDRGF
ncbi:hypothetical protein RF55_19928 [Lasius niger]|uniref:Uncharacterized protein n=1 Tax=Lasius niger TaxID=67767 RepID=A0A0J7JZH8_LASNI|nr:hypothetical protein RF55_19928 [Lasius niger]